MGGSVSASTYMGSMSEKPHIRHVGEGDVGVGDPVVVLSLAEVGPARNALEDLGDVRVGQVEEPDEVVRLVVAVLAADYDCWDGPAGEEGQKRSPPQEGAGRREC